MMYKILALESEHDQLTAQRERLPCLNCNPQAEETAKDLDAQIDRVTREIDRCPAD